MLPCALNSFKVGTEEPHGVFIAVAVTHQCWINITCVVAPWNIIFFSVCVLSHPLPAEVLPRLDLQNVLI